MMTATGKTGCESHSSQPTLGKQVIQATALRVETGKRKTSPETRSEDVADERVLVISNADSKPDRRRVGQPNSGPNHLIRRVMAR